MLVACYCEPGDVRLLQDAPGSKPGPTEILVRVRANSICGTDAKIFDHGHHRLVPPRVLGHEPAGEMVEGRPGRRREPQGRRPGPRHRRRPANGSSPAQNRKALEYIASAAVPVADLITHRLPLEKFVDGLAAVTDGTAIKVTIEP